MVVDPRAILRMRPLIKKEAIFNQKCKTHKSLYLNKYCMDCNAEPLCHKCDDENPAGPAHVGHKTIQVTKSTRRNAVKAEEVKEVMDGSDILRLLNNSVSVFMLLTRGKPEEWQDAGMRRHCIKCGFPMLATTAQPDARYCSIECKLEDVDMDLLPDQMHLPDSGTTTADCGMPVSSPTAAGASVASFGPTRNGAFCCGVERTHRRKGHPHRAPLC